MTVKIVTDSLADLPPEIVKELGISIVPLVVNFGDESYRDGIDLSPEQFYEKLKTSKVFPHTSVPSPGVFAEVYDELAKETDKILVIAVSARLSGTYQVALQAARLMKHKCQVEIIQLTLGNDGTGFHRHGGRQSS